MGWIIFGVGSAVIALYFFEGRAEKRKIEEAFSGRQRLDPAGFYERFFREQGIPEAVAVGVRKVLEDQLGADLSRLEASDDFSKNIGFFFDFDSMADVEIVCALEEEFSITISDQEAKNAHTVQDIVDLVWSKVRARA